MDAPIVVDQGPGLPLWRPENFEKSFLGPTTLRVGLEKSRNLMTVRVAQAIGMKKVAETAKRFGIVDNLPPVLAMALGAGETTVLRLTTAYAMHRQRRQEDDADPDRPRPGQARPHHLPHRQPALRRLRRRRMEGSGAARRSPTPASRWSIPPAAYQMVSMMQGVVQRGTGAIVGQLGRPLAGKTGTTNDSNDAWFVGFSPDLAVGCYIGYDKPRSLGDEATGGAIIAPLFRDFMTEALKDQPNVPFRIPPGIRLVRVNLATGQRAEPGDSRVIFEAFKPGTEPNGDNSQVDHGHRRRRLRRGRRPDPGGGFERRALLRVRQPDI